MAFTKAPKRSGRRKGLAVVTTSPIAKLVMEEMHNPPMQKGRRHSMRDAAKTATARVKRGNLKSRAPQAGSGGRLPLQPPGTHSLNRSNVKRKPEARRGSPRKKLMKRN